MESEEFLSRLEQLQFTLNEANSLPSSQADVYRNLYLLNSMQAKMKESRDEYSAFLTESDRNLEMYANIVDNMEKTGLNNFAAGALSLCHHHKNESSKWQSSLCVEDILRLTNIQETMEGTRNGMMDDDEGVMIPIRTRKTACVDKDLTNSYPNILPTTQNLCPPGKKNLLPNSSVFQHRSESPCRKPPEIPKQGFNAGLRKPWVGGGPTCHEGHSGKDNVSVTVSVSKVGGPYANFGQKRKSQPAWNSARDGNRHCGGTTKRNDEDEEDGETEKQIPFRTAREQLIINQQKKKMGATSDRDRGQVTGSNYGAVKKSLGTRRGPAAKFVPPVLGQETDGSDGSFPSSMSRHRDKTSHEGDNGEPVDERLKGIDPNMIELIRNDIMDQGTAISWSDIAGLEFAKKTIQEIVVWPMLRPDIFTGLRGPPKGLLLFGPPGTGKTLIGKCIASQSKSTFFCISASSLTSKWVGEGEKMVRALFAVARCSQPAVVFIDEVDSLLSQRSDSEHESSRRIKTEFLVQLDGASTASEERLLVIGATNRPQEIDEAARRRFVKRLLIPLPESVARKQIVLNLMSQQTCRLSDSDLEQICEKSKGYSGADMSNLCREAALGPIRSIPFEQMESITPDQVRPILMEDFEHALLQVRASVSSKDLELYADWNKTYGSFGQG